MSTRFRLARKAFLILICAGFPRPALSQTTYDVTTNADNTNTGTLRTAITNASGGGDTILFGGSYSGGTISLTSNLPSISGNTTLEVTNASPAVTIAPNTPASPQEMPLSGSVMFDITGSNPLTISAVLSDGSSPGSLTLEGGGQLDLTGANTYSGGTTIGTGILNINADAALGSASGGITFEGGTLQLSASTASARTISLLTTGTIDTYGNNLTLSGVISGGGSLTVEDSSSGGGGVLSLTGSNTYTGGTTIATGGTLGINSSANLGSGILTFNGGTLQIQTSSLSYGQNIILDSGGGTFETSGSTATFSGIISGSGPLVETSSGTLVLTAANVGYTGTTSIQGGTIAISNDNNLGVGPEIILSNGGTLRTLSGITDSRTIMLEGGAGVQGGGGIIDTYGSDSTFSGQITGSGSLTEVGGGVLTLSNPYPIAGSATTNYNNYSGGTFVESGTLELGANDNLPAGGGLTIDNGSTFNMNGYSQANNALGTVTNNGTIDVGASTLKLASYSGTGTLAVQLNSSPNITVTSSAMNLSGGTLAVSFATPPLRNGQSFTPITTSGTGSITGTGNITGPAAFSFTENSCTALSPCSSLSVTANFVPFANSAASPNQAAVANGIEGIRANPTGDAAVVMSSLYSMNAAQLQSALDQIGPVSFGAMRGLGVVNSSLQSGAVDQRVTSLSDDSNVAVFQTSGRQPYPGTLVAQADAVEPMDAIPFSMPLPKQPWSNDTPWGLYASAIGSRGQLSSFTNSSGQQPGYSFQSGGLNAGSDYRFNEHFAAGVSAGYLRGTETLDAPDTGVVSSQSTRLGAYAAVFADNFHADLYAGGAIDDYSTSRTIAFLDRTATASPQGREINIHSIADYSLPSEGPSFYAPFLGLDFDRLDIDSFSESGAGSVDLNVSPETSTSLRSTLGIEWSRPFHSGWDDFRPYASAGWRHEFENQDQPIQAQLGSAVGSSQFTVNTGAMARDGMALGAGIIGDFDDNILVKLAYAGDYRPQFTDNTLEASVRLRF